MFAQTEGFELKKRTCWNPESEKLSGFLQELICSLADKVLLSFGTGNAFLSRIIRRRSANRAKPTKGCRPSRPASCGNGFRRPPDSPDLRCAHFTSAPIRSRSLQKPRPQYLWPLLCVSSGPEGEVDILQKYLLNSMEGGCQVTWQTMDPQKVGPSS
jgi:hypothetical protein